MRDSSPIGDKESRAEAECVVRSDLSNSFEAIEEQGIVSMGNEIMLNVQRRPDWGGRMDQTDQAPDVRTFMENGQLSEYVAPTTLTMHEFKAFSNLTKSQPERKATTKPRLSRRTVPCYDISEALPASLDREALLDTVFSTVQPEPYRSGKERWIRCAVNGLIIPTLRCHDITNKVVCFWHARHQDFTCSGPDCKKIGSQLAANWQDGA